MSTNNNNDKFLRGFGMGKHDSFHGKFRTRSQVGCGAEFYSAYEQGFDRGQKVKGFDPSKAEQHFGNGWVTVPVEELHLHVG